MAKPNYAFAKRQRDLAKKAKKEEKRLRKAGAEGDRSEGADADGSAHAPEGTAQEAQPQPEQAPAVPAADEK